jgi:predicted NBD/HSP70 family sugar kinase
MHRMTVRDLRRVNRVSVLKRLYLDGTASRLQLAAVTGLSPATVGTVVTELIQEEIVEETGQIDSDGGRPATLLDIRIDRNYAIGVDVGERSVQAELFDLRLNRLEAASRPLVTSGVSASNIVAVVSDAVSELLRALPSGSNLLGVGVGIPGIVDDDDEAIVDAPSLGWAGVPLKRMLAAEIDRPLFIDNGAKTMGRAESWFGAGRDVPALVVAVMGTGVGAAIIINGAVYRGAASTAGEWGHAKIVVDGAACRCGGRGCLEAYVGTDAIVARYRAYNKRVPGDLRQDEVLSRLAAEAADGRPGAVRTVEETATYLAAGIGTLANIVNPSVLVIGGEVSVALADALLPVVREKLAAYALSPALRRFSITVSQFGADAVAMGAATLPIERFLAVGGRTGTPRSAGVREVASW